MNQTGWHIKAQRPHHHHLYVINRSKKQQYHEERSWQSQFAFFLCPFFFWMIVLGRTIIAYNSIFVALIRYVYIVHERKANQWDFESVGRRFQIASISVPIINVMMLGLTMRPRYFLPDADTNICSHMTPPLITFTMTFVSEPVSDTIAIGSAVLVTVVYLNLVEGYLYVKIFQSIKR